MFIDVHQHRHIKPGGLNEEAKASVALLVKVVGTTDEIVVVAPSNMKCPGFLQHDLVLVSHSRSMAC